MHYSPWGHKKSDMTEATKRTHTILPMGNARLRDSLVARGQRPSEQ